MKFVGGAVIPFFLLLVSDVNAQVPPVKDRDNGLIKNGLHVCHLTETISVQVVVTYQSQVTSSVYYRTCCGRGLWWKCVLPCEKTKIGIKTYNRTRLQMKQADRLVYHCCAGWDRNTKTESECKKPICGFSCKNGGKCVSPDTCQCKEGFHGKVCQLDVNECKNQSKNKCEHLCINTPGGFKCSCRRGYSLNPDGKTCDEINECLASKSPCQCKQNDGVCQASCTNTAGSYTCKCNDGYRLNSAERCEEINECFENDKLCDQKCVNKLGSYQCECFKGFQYNNTTGKCEDINECSVNNGGCSDQCLNLNSSHVCLCPQGKYLDKDRRTCKVIDSSMKVKTVCQSDGMVMLTCDIHTNKINITSAFYGRTSDTVCQKGDYKSDLKCADDTVFDRVKFCNGMPSCLVMMAGQWPDKPCPGVEKYLRIVYICQK